MTEVISVYDDGVRLDIPFELVFYTMDETASGDFL